MMQQSSSSHLLQLETGHRLWRLPEGTCARQMELSKLWKPTEGLKPEALLRCHVYQCFWAEPAKILLPWDGQCSALALYLWQGQLAFTEYDRVRLIVADPMEVLLRLHHCFCMQDYSASFSQIQHETAGPCVSHGHFIEYTRKMTLLYLSSWKLQVKVLISSSSSQSNALFHNAASFWVSFAIWPADLNLKHPSSPPALLALPLQPMAMHSLYLQIQRWTSCLPK